MPHKLSRNLVGGDAAARHWLHRADFLSTGKHESPSFPRHSPKFEAGLQSEDSNIRESITTHDGVGE
jgi:hypothetical protein